jgi:hypothetical protein
MAIPTIERVERYSPYEYDEMINDFSLRDVVEKTLLESMAVYEETEAAIEWEGGSVITEIIEAAPDDYVLIPPEDVAGSEYIVAKIARDNDTNRSERTDTLGIGNEITIEADGDEGVLVKADGEVRFVTTAELREVATADDLETVAIN